jgi:hypothetical protein
MESVDLNGATENHSKKAKRGRPKTEKGRSKADDISGDERAAVRACLAEITKAVAVVAEGKCSTTQVLINFFRSKPASQVSIYRSNANELN